MKTVKDVFGVFTDHCINRERSVIGRTPEILLQECIESNGRRKGRTTGHRLGINTRMSRRCEVTSIPDPYPLVPPTWTWSFRGKGGRTLGSDSQEPPVFVSPCIGCASGAVIVAVCTEMGVRPTLCLVEGAGDEGNLDVQAQMGTDDFFFCPLYVLTSSTPTRVPRGRTSLPRLVSFPSLSSPRRRTGRGGVWYSCHTDPKGPTGLREPSGGSDCPPYRATSLPSSHSRNQTPFGVVYVFQVKFLL